MIELITENKVKDTRWSYRAQTKISGHRKNFVKRLWPLGRKERAVHDGGNINRL